ncbi:hypothetical protein QUF88_14765 [Bacillus sp. DX1.1]|uniref:hypothetical protein n=1 Tax=unclassified Bacillus (in: firmicutes) TaxID=185979 RepID=UPI00256FC770|nr:MULTISPECIES: hypothetical protein [unclassified Bacillus (in: firmicutes)]MDM5155032.1 hypothetical protein [Bacillus sp. DX1.1]WJE83892.1 hypothetical protein QRE67_12260 [Bacillus sp. DX3.1]
MDNDMTSYASLMNYIIIALQLAIFLMVVLYFIKKDLLIAIIKKMIKKDIKIEDIGLLNAVRYLLFKGIIIQVTVTLILSFMYGLSQVTPMYVSFVTNIVLLVFFSFELNYKMDKNTFNKTKRNVFLILSFLVTVGYFSVVLDFFSQL